MKAFEKDIIHHLPIIILTPEHRCNCRCLMCHYWKSGNNEPMSSEIIEKILPEWLSLGVRWVGLSGGEPLLYPRFADLCGMVASANIRLSLMTNGLELAENAETVARYCKDIYLSLDGPPSVHDRIRNVSGAFDRLSQGVCRLRAKNPDIEMIARCTVQGLNHEHLKETVKTALFLGLNRISFIAVDSRSGSFRRFGETAIRSQALNREAIDRLEAEIDVLEREYSWAFGGFIVDSKARLRNRLLGYFKAELKMARYPGHRCNAPWVSAVIEADGSVRPCFFHPPIGNVREDSLRRIINSEKALEFRKRLDVHNDPVCERCVCSLDFRPLEWTEK